jgi:hypothetical protein
MLAAAFRGYGEALDPRLRRAPSLGLGGGLAHFTAPLLEALSRPDDVRCARHLCPPSLKSFKQALNPIKCPAYRFRTDRPL